MTTLPVRAERRIAGGPCDSLAKGVTTNGFAVINGIDVSVSHCPRFEWRRWPRRCFAISVSMCVFFKHDSKVLQARGHPCVFRFRFSFIIFSLCVWLQLVARWPMCDSHQRSADVCRADQPGSFQVGLIKLFYGKCGPPSFQHLAIRDPSRAEPLHNI